MWRKLGPLVWLALLGVVAGCQSGDPRTPSPTGDLVVLFPGVGTGGWSLSEARRALRDAGVTAEIRIQPWDRPAFDFFGHLQDLKTNRAEAARVAGELAEYRHAHPAARIDLVGYSGGGGVALLVVEALPDDVRPCNVLLVQPGVSPTWDLTTVLHKIDGRLINFRCQSDWLILDAGTRIFGTIDRKNVAAAGKDGFDVAAAVPDEGQRSRLIQRDWIPRMIWTGHLGNHLGILLYAWNRDYVAPYLRPEAPPSGAT